MLGKGHNSCPIGVDKIKKGNFAVFSDQHSKNISRSMEGYKMKSLQRVLLFAHSSLLSLILRIPFII